MKDCIIIQQQKIYISQLVLVFLLSAFRYEKNIPKNRINSPDFNNKSNTNFNTKKKLFQQINFFFVGLLWLRHTFSLHH